jgi:hypothetical protein
MGPIYEGERAEAGLDGARAPDHAAPVGHGLPMEESDDGIPESDDEL